MAYGKQIASIVTVIILGLMAAYFFTARPLIAPTEDNYRTYSDQQYGFSFTYPSRAGLTAGFHPRYNVGEFFAAAGNSLVTVALPESDFAGTNAYAVFLTVAIGDESIGQTTCYQWQNEGADSVGTLIASPTGDVSLWYQGETNGAAAGTMAQTKIYHAYHNNRCFEVSLNLFQGNIANYDPGSITPVDETQAFFELQSIFGTFKFL